MKGSRKHYRESGVISIGKVYVQHKKTCRCMYDMSTKQSWNVESNRLITAIATSQLNLIGSIYGFHWWIAKIIREVYFTYGNGLLFKVWSFYTNKSPYTTLTVVRLFFDNIVRLYGICETIVNDRMWFSQALFERNCFDYVAPNCNFLQFIITRVTIRQKLSVVF